VIEEISGASIIEGVSLGTIKIIDKELLIITSFAFRERERERESKEN